MRNFLSFLTVCVFVLTSSTLFAQVVVIDGSPKNDLIEIDVLGLNQLDQEETTWAAEPEILLKGTKKEKGPVVKINPYASSQIVVKINGVVKGAYLTANPPTIITIRAKEGDDEIIYDPRASLFTVIRLHTGDDDDTIRPNQSSSNMCISNASYKLMILNGGDGDDSLHASCGDDVVVGDFGNDTINVGGHGNDLVWGREGDDEITASTGDDVDCGGDSGDILRHLTGYVPTYTDCASVQPF